MADQNKSGQKDQQKSVSKGENKSGQNIEQETQNDKKAEATKGS